MSLPKTSFAELRNIIKRDRAQGRDLYKKLSLAEKMSLILSASGKERFDLIFADDMPEEIVRGMHEQDLYITTKEAGFENAPYLIGISTPEQFQFFLDWDVWNKDRFDHKKAAEWFQLVNEYNPIELANRIFTLDRELLILFFQGILTIRRRESYQDPAEFDEGYHYTSDDIYFITYNPPSENYLYFNKIFDLIVSFNYRFFSEIMEAILIEISSELEEYSYRFRKGRLEDRGFPDYFEAVGIYQPVDPNGDLAWAKRPQKQMARSTAAAEEKPPLPVLYAGIFENQSFFKAAYEKLTEKALPSVQEDILHLTNNALIAERVTLNDRKGIHNTLTFVHNFISIGLEFRSNQNLDIAVDLLKTYHIQIFFKIGYSLVIQLRKVYGGSSKGEPDLRFVQEGLSKNPPMLYQGPGAKNSNPYRYFSTLADILGLQQKRGDKG